MTIVWAFPKLPASQERGSRCGQGGWGGGGGQPAGEPSARGVHKISYSLLKLKQFGGIDIIKIFFKKKHHFTI